MRNNIVEILLLLLKGCFDRSFVDPCLSARNVLSYFYRARIIFRSFVILKSSIGPVYLPNGYSRVCELPLVYLFYLQHIVAFFD